MTDASAPLPPVPSRARTNPCSTNPLFQHLVDTYKEDPGHVAQQERLWSWGGNSSSKGRKGGVSHKAAVRKNQNREKEEAYQDRMEGRVVRHQRRKHRMEKLKKMY